MNEPTGRPMCEGSSTDPGLFQKQVSEGELGRLATSTGPGQPTPGFPYLENGRSVCVGSTQDSGDAQGWHSDF